MSSLHEFPIVKILEEQMVVKNEGKKTTLEACSFSPKMFHCIRTASTSFQAVYDN